MQVGGNNVEVAFHEMAHYPSIKCKGTVSLFLCCSTGFGITFGSSRFMSSWGNLSLFSDKWENNKKLQGLPLCVGDEMFSDPFSVNSGHLVPFTNIYLKFRKMNKLKIFQNHLNNNKYRIFVKYYTIIKYLSKSLWVT